MQAISSPANNGVTLPYCLWHMLLMHVAHTVPNWVNSPEISIEGAKTIELLRLVWGFSAEQANLHFPALAWGLEAEVGQGMMWGEIWENWVADSYSLGWLERAQRLWLLSCPWSKLLSTSFGPGVALNKLVGALWPALKFHLSCFQLP